ERGFGSRAARVTRLGGGAAYRQHEADCCRCEFHKAGPLGELKKLLLDAVSRARRGAARDLRRNAGNGERAAAGRDQDYGVSTRRNIFPDSAYRGICTITARSLHVTSRR